MSAPPPVALPPATLAPAPVLLNYAETRRRWDRNVSYLLTILCTSQLLLIPAPLIYWCYRFAYPAPGTGFPIRGLRESATPVTCKNSFVNIPR
jgi:hypothetical protein